MKTVKFILAVILLPGVWTSVRFGVGLLGEARAVGWSWIMGDGAWFMGGVAAWLVVFAVGPYGRRVYVFGHELTHALAVWLSGGRVTAFHVGREGGHIVADREGTVISLAPYLVPLYPVAVVLAWVAAVWAVPEWGRYGVGFLAVWGGVWSFHVSFTLWVMRQEQSDFASQGYVFSMVVVFLVNWWLGMGAVWLATGEYGLVEGARLFAGMAAGDYATVGEWIGQGALWLWRTGLDVVNGGG